MGLGKWKQFADYYRAYSSDVYEDTMSAVERLASTSLVILNEKPVAERNDILDKSRVLTDKIMETVDQAPPMVAALSLLTALRVVEKLIEQQSHP